MRIPLWLPLVAALLRPAVAAPSADTSPWLGITLQPLDPRLAEELAIPDLRGALVSDVEPGSPADSAGLRPLDVIVAAEGLPVGRPADLARLIQPRQPGDRLSFTLARAGGREEIQIRLGRRPAPEPPQDSTPPPAPAQDSTLPPAPVQDSSTPPAPPRLGVQVVRLPETLAHYFRARPGQGALIVHLEPGGAAEKAGLQAGDVILAFADERIGTPRDLQRALRDHGPGTADLRLLRRGREMRAKVDLPQTATASEPWESLVSRGDLERLRAELARGQEAAARELELLQARVEALRRALADLDREPRP